MQAKIVNLWFAFLLLFVLIATVATTLLQSAHSNAFEAQRQPDLADEGKQKPIGRMIEQPGSLVPFERVDIYSRITGYVGEWFVDLGDHVKKGQLLAKVEASELQQKLEKKKAMVHKAQVALARARQAALVLAAAVERKKSEVQETKAALAQSEAVVRRWNAEYERGKKLLQQNISDRTTVDEIANQLRAAQLAELQAGAKIKTAEAAQKEVAAHRDQGDTDIELAQADVQAAKAEVAQVNALLQQAEVRAPFDGVVIRRLANTGAMAGPPSTVRSEPMFTLARVDLLRVVVEIPELDSVQVTRGIEATMRFQAFPGQVFKGRVARTAEALDPNRRTLRVEIDLPNPEGKLLSGMYANVTLTPKGTQPKKKE